MKHLIPKDTHLEILNEVGSWKVISQKCLHKNIDRRYHYNSFCKIINTLETNNLLKSIKGNRGLKHLYLTGLGSELSNYPSLYDESPTELRHDYTTSLVLQTALEFKNFNFSKAIYSDISGIIPDGVIYATKEGIDYSLAIEVELTQKAKKRIITRFNKYLKECEYSYVLFLFNKESVFKSYKEVLNSLKESAHFKIILGLDENICRDGLNIDSKNYWFKNKSFSFLEIFG